MSTRDETAQRVIDAASRLLASGGRAAITTRAVGAESGVHAPAIYRLFGDMDGLLQAVAAEGFRRYLAGKESRKRSADPVDDLRAGWDLHVQFGLENPAHYALMFGGSTSAAPPAAKAALEVLRGLVQAVAKAERLSTTIELAAAMMHAGAVGVTFTLISSDISTRNLAVSVQVREAIIAAITGDTPPVGPAVASRAVALSSVLDDAPPVYTPGERALLGELLARLSERPGRPREGS